MADQFIYCPRCGSTVYQTDYEDRDGNEDTDGRACNDDFKKGCRWEGDVAELVCKD